jgi:hypothetical protein
MFLATQAAQYAGLDHVIYICAFVAACCLLLLTWFSESVRNFWKPFPGGTAFAVAALLVIIGLSAALLH